jgi:hypothetical protein
MEAAVLIGSLSAAGAMAAMFVVGFAFGWNKCHRTTLEVTNPEPICGRCLHHLDGCLCSSEDAGLRQEVACAYLEGWKDRDPAGRVTDNMQAKFDSTTGATPKHQQKGQTTWQTLKGRKL